MLTSSERILTTHVGSLPRSAAVADLLLKKEYGEAVDDTHFEAILREAVSDAVQQQLAAGIDVVSDGELSKISYATYIKDRLSGFAGHRPRKPALDLQPFPEYMEKMALVAGKQTFKRLCCTGPIRVVATAPLEFDLVNFRDALNAHPAPDAFMNAASPGVVSAFQPNEYYATHADYLDAISTAMRAEYEAIVNAGFVLQVDCPDLAMARHTGFQDLSEAEFL
ncbi:MAG: epoxyalkane--coenzyme M transferase, partial [Pseudomonadota bacterium]|nr:epoxyalkane--coenzyme M transferase [Pseudomonadota bacterium]